MKLIKLLLTLFLVGLLIGCNEQEPITTDKQAHITVEVKYYFNKELIYSYRAFVEYDSVKFWGASAENYEEAKENVIKKVRQYIKAKPTPRLEKVEL